MSGKKKLLEECNIRKKKVATTTPDNYRTYGAVEKPTPNSMESAAAHQSRSEAEIPKGVYPPQEGLWRAKANRKSAS